MEQGFFTKFAENISKAKQVLADNGNQDLSEDLSNNFQEVEKILINLNDALYTSYKLSLNVLENSQAMPEDSKEELKKNLKNLIELYEKRMK